MREDTLQAIKTLRDSAITIAARNFLVTIDARREFHSHINESVEKLRRSVARYLRE